MSCLKIFSAVGKEEGLVKDNMKEYTKFTIRIDNMQ